MPYSVILFDLDGTLTDSGPGILNAAAYALAQMGRPVPSREALRRFVGPPLTASFREFCGMTPAEAEEATRLFRVYYNRQGWRENAPYPGAEDCLRALRGAGKTLAVATSKPQAMAERVLEHFHLMGYFAAVFGGSLDEGHNSKPQVVADALAACGVTDLSTAILLGDRRYDMEGAARNGIHAIGLLHGYGSRAELAAAGATDICDSFSDALPLLLEER